jgi:hypothetical protein
MKTSIQAPLPRAKPWWIATLVAVASWIFAVYIFSSSCIPMGGGGSCTRPFDFPDFLTIYGMVWTMAGIPVVGTLAIIATIQSFRLYVRKRHVIGTQKDTP